MKVPLKVLFAASECVPFVKTGGLADVAGALPPQLKARGVDVRVVLPLYGQIGEQWRSQMRTVVEFEADLGWRHQYCGIRTLEYQGVTYYFVDNEFYFHRPYVYGLGGDEYERFGFFCRAILDMLTRIDFQPDVIHCNDWQSAMVPPLLKIQYANAPFYSNIRTMLTIHNLQYQGVFPIKNVQDTLGLGDDLFSSDKLECYGCANFLKGGMVYADEITTVSPSYADEIQTAYYGERLDGLLRARHHQLQGILNGIDIVEYNPEADPLIYAPYSAQAPAAKAENKAALQREMGLHTDPGAPLIGLVTRLSHQKGLDLIDYVIRELMDEGIQLAVLGMGDAKYTDLFSWAEGAFPGRIAARFAMDNQLAHRIYAGADMFLMPSLFEPCGLSQMISLRYGTLPIVRETGGLRDTVLSYNKFTDEGNGFTFFNYNAHDMLHSVKRAVRYYREQPEVWGGMMRRGMESDFSWNRSAGEYIGLYERLTSAPQPKATAKKTVKTIQAAEAATAPEGPAAKKTPEKKVTEKKSSEKKSSEKIAPAKKPAKASEQVSGGTEAPAPKKPRAAKPKAE